MWLVSLGRNIGWQIGSVGAVVLSWIGGSKRHRPPPAQRAPEVRSLLHALPEPVFLLDKVGRVADLNSAAEELIGTNRRELLGQEGDGLLRRGLSDSDPSESPLRRALRGESTSKHKQILQKSREESRQVVVSANPVCDSHGSVNGALMSIQDVTELSALQQQADSNERHLAVGQMTAGLVHDFNNVLNTISEAVAILELDQGRPEREMTILNIISNAVHHGSEIARTMRKYLVGNREKPARLDIRHLLDEVLELADPVLRTHADVNVVRKSQTCLDVYANANDLRRAFTNLVLNALDAMPQGGTLTVGCAQKNHRVIVTFRDTGTGIPWEAQKKIFSAYFTTKVNGTGLGLAGARRAVESQGGQIKFESRPGAGTTFYVSLPSVDSAGRTSPSAA